MQLDRDVVTRKENFGTAITIGFIDYFIAPSSADRPGLGNSQLLLSSVPEPWAYRGRRVVGGAGVRLVSLSKSQAERLGARIDPPGKHKPKNDKPDARSVG